MKSSDQKKTGEAVRTDENEMFPLRWIVEKAAREEPGMSAGEDG